MSDVTLLSLLNHAQQVWFEVDDFGRKILQIKKATHDLTIAQIFAVNESLDILFKYGLSIVKFLLSHEKGFWRKKGNIEIA